MKTTALGLVPIHIGQPEPLTELDHFMRERAAQLNNWGQRAGPLLHVPAELDWEGHGLQPRWLGMESSDCAVAIEPGRFSGRGSEERNRFLAGAAHRNETAVLISVLGDPEAEMTRNVFSGSDASVDVGDHTHIIGNRLPSGPTLGVAPGLGKADQDLALRLRNRGGTAPWWALQRSRGTSLHSGSGESTYIPATGRLEPLLVNGLDEPVAAVWVSDDERRRWYVLPAGVRWETILDWLQQQALPEFLPGALRRVRSPRFVDPDLQSRREIRATEGLRDMEARHAQERLKFEEELAAAKESADGMRHGLLYESGTSLAKAVQEVLQAADLHVIDLDAELGATRSADLLVSPTANGDPRRLVEVKGVGGTASEKLVQALEGHLRTWPQLRPHQPVAGGVLVVNHQHKMDPADRSEQVYQRKEFVDSLSVTVLSARQLYDWWREENWAAIREAILGAQVAAAPASPKVHDLTEAPPIDSPPAPKRKGWGRFFT